MKASEEEGAEMLKSALIRSAFLGILAASVVLADLEPETKVIGQPSAPLRISEYKAYYARGSQYTTEGIHHSLQYENISGRNIVAFRVGLVSFDVFNKFLGKMGGVSIEDTEPGKARKGQWVARHYGEFSFHTGVAYVETVRFENGEIWTTELDTIIEELRRIEEGFDAARLVEEKKETR